MRLAAGGFRVLARVALLMLGCAPPRATPAPVVPAVAPSAWPGIVRLAGPPPPVDCSTNLAHPVFLWGTQGGAPQPVQIRPRPTVVEPLPFPEPPELSARRGSERRVIPVDGGWLVAMNHGEFGAGLFSVKANTLALERLDANLHDEIRWIGSTTFGVVGVGGLCHGGPPWTTTVYQLFSVNDIGWRLHPLAVLEGCPGDISVGPDGASLLVAAASGGLERIDQHAAKAGGWSEISSHRVADYPEHLLPWQVLGRREPSSSEEVYHVSFGQVLARFGERGAEWFGAAACPSVVADANHRCQCAGAEASAESSQPPGASSLF